MCLTPFFQRQRITHTHTAHVITSVSPCVCCVNPGVKTIKLLRRDDVVGAYVEGVRDAAH
jgi:hypothetical protein